MTSASIVTYHVDLGELAQALDCLAGSGVEKVYIVDNGSEQRVADFCKDREGVRYIASANHGYGAGHNQALRRAIAGGAKYHLVLNSDIVFSGPDIESMTAYMDANPDVGALHPRIVGLDGNDQFTVRMLPTPADLLLRRFLPKSWCQASRDRYLLKHLSRDKIHSIPYMQGSFMLLRCEALKKVGLFDERYFMYPEDIDLTRRIAARYKAIYYPYAKVVHAHRGESYTSWRMTWVHICNMAKYFNKWGWLRDPARAAWRKALSAD